MKRALAILVLLLFAHASLGQLSGPLSGTVGPGTFNVVDTISVEANDTLRLLPGTTFTFDGGFPFLIYGVLLAEGTGTDSIFFTTDTLANPNRWRGLRFSESTSSSSRLSYCVIEKGLASAEWELYEGGGVYCSSSSPAVMNSAIRENSADYGGGVRCDSYSSPTFTNCAVTGNSALDYGGGVFSTDGSSPIFVNCSISNNRAGSIGGGVACWNGSPAFNSCLFSHNSARDGGGFDCNDSSSSPIFTNCVFEHNSASNLGGGMSCRGNSRPIFMNCIWGGNWAFYSGGGMVIAVSFPYLSNCTLFGNISQQPGGAVDCRVSSVTFTSTVIAFSEGAGICFDRSASSRVQYCDVFGNSGGRFSFFNDDPSNGPPDIGQVSTTNPNGDLCDQYYNIFLDPMFADTAAGDFHLLAGSPCIDAGDPTLPLDPDSTVTDIGAFYYHQSAVEPLAITAPTVYALHPNWPNPFNPRTTIPYDVAQAGQVRLMIFNVLGQEVARLVDGHQLAGSHTISWDATNSPSGIYLCRMEASGFAQTRKLVLLK